MTSQRQAFRITLSAIQQCARNAAGEDRHAKPGIHRGRCFFLRDPDTQRIYQLSDLTKASSFGLVWPIAADAGGSIIG